MPWPEQLHEFDCVTSTMNHARDLAEAGAPHGSVVVAREQTGGKGRKGRSWFSPKDGGWYATVVLRPSVAMERAGELSLVAGACLLTVLHECGVSTARLKWPNDIVVGERKMAGILSHMQQTGDGGYYVLVGVGVNTMLPAGAKLPAELNGTYVAVCDVAAEPLTAADIQARFVPALETMTDAWQNDGIGLIRDIWQKNDALFGVPLRAELAGNTIEGVGAGLAEDGGLFVRCGDVVETVHFGEIQTIHINGGVKA